MKSGGSLHVLITSNSSTCVTGNPPVKNVKTGGNPDTFDGITVALVVEIGS